MYTMEYYSMIKKNSDIAIWKLQNTLLSEKSHTLHYFICMNFNNTELIYGERNETAFACGGGGGSGGGLNGKGNEGNFGGDGNSLYLDLGEDIIRTYICQNSSNYILKICALYYW